MTTTRLPRDRENPFAVTSIALLRNNQISGTESRILQILLSMPEGWQPNAKHLSTCMTEGTYAISRALKRLKDLGYLVCHSVRDSFGKFLRTDWDIHEAPQKPEGKNLDINGNIIEFDSATKRKNLRQTAKEKRVKAKPETVAVRASNPHLDFPNMDNRNRSNINIPNIHLNLEREAGFLKQEEEEGEDLTRDLELHVNKKSESCTEPEVLELDKCSAKAELAESELNNFKAQLEDLGKKLGRHSPLGWAFKIVQNLRDGKASTYWDEFRAGMPLGTSEQQEWEIEPGVACTIAVQCLQQDYLSRPGATPQEAALKAARTIARPKEMAAVWESIKSQVMFRRSEWQRQSELGVQSPVLDSWMTPKPVVSVKEVAVALQEIQSALPEVLKNRSEFGQGQELKALQSQAESVSRQIGESQFQPIADVVIEDALVESVIEETPADDTAAIIAVAKANISAVLRKFARPGKRAARLAANIAEANCDTISSPVKASNSGGLADYLLQAEVIEDEEIW